MIWELEKNENLVKQGCQQLKRGEFESLINLFSHTQNRKERSLNYSRQTEFQVEFYINYIHAERPSRHVEMQLALQIQVRNGEKFSSIPNNGDSMSVELSSQVMELPKAQIRDLRTNPWERLPLTQHEKKEGVVKEMEIVGKDL